MKNIFKNSKSNNTAEIKDFISDYAYLLGKVFITGCAVVGAVKAAKDAVKANDEFDKKWLLK